MKLRQMGLPCISLILVTWMAAGAASADQLERGKEVFQVNCAVCHGPEGRPDPDSPVVQGLGVEPANFADALFNSREPVGDWEMVVTHGGAALAFSEQMPAFGEVLPKEDIDAVQEEIHDILRTVEARRDNFRYDVRELQRVLPTMTEKSAPVVRTVAENGPKEAALSVDGAKVYVCKFNRLQAEKDLALAQAAYRGERYQESIDYSRKVLAGVAVMKTVQAK